MITIRTLLRDFIPTYILLIIIFGFGLFLIIFYPSLVTTNSFLVASKTNLLGAITSIFVNATFKNYLNELAVFAIVTLFLVISNTQFIRSKRRQRAINFVIISVICGVIANEMGIFLPNSALYTIGPSGVTFAGFGVVAAFALFNLLCMKDIFKGKINWGETLSIGVIIAVVYYVFFSSAAFFSVAPGIAYTVHEIAFLISFVFTAISLTIFQYFR